MLAASYGVAMARHVELADQAFAGVILPKYARGLYEALFAENAPDATTHILLREYAFRTIELALRYQPGLLTKEEADRCRAPFASDGLREWGESEILAKLHHGSGSPLRMDFENYTIGGLVSGRANYDYGHPEYKKVRSRILWRVEQLGWTKDLFESVDALIASSRPWRRIEDGTDKIDRYGKKYSWIAYFEMAGLLQDKGALENWAERTSAVDIDPSFPERVSYGKVIPIDFLGDSQTSTEDWILNGPIPDIDPYLRMDTVLQMEGPWIALDGLVAQEDEARGRKSFCFIRSFLVANDVADGFVDRLSRQSLGGRWLPEKPSVVYVFAGEIPWCTVFPENGFTEIQFILKSEKSVIQRPEPRLFIDGKIIDAEAIELQLRNLFGPNAGDPGELAKLDDEELKRIEVREVLTDVEEVKEEYAEYKAMVPVRDFEWESYHSITNDAGRAVTLAKGISVELNLLEKPQTFDLFSSEGIRATVNVAEEEGFNNQQSMFYMREDMLRAFLQKNRLTLVWAIWGERGYSHDRLEKLLSDAMRPNQAYQVFGRVTCFT